MSDKDMEQVVGGVWYNKGSVKISWRLNYMQRVLQRMLALVVLMLVIMPVGAWAEKTDFKDSSYNFKQVKSVAVYDMDFSKIDMEEDSVQAKSMQAVYQDKLHTAKLPIVDEEMLLRKISLLSGQDMDLLYQSNPEEYEQVYWEKLPEVADVYITSEVKEYKSSIIFHPAYTSWERRTKYITVKDSDGNSRRVEIEYDEPVYHPESYSTQFYVTVEFRAYDTKTGKEIFSRVDARDREDYEGKDMYARICANFAKDFAKLMK